MRKPYLLSVIALVLILAGIFYYYYYYSSWPEIGPNEAILIINFGETKRAFAGQTIEEMTVYDLLLGLSETGNIDIDFSNSLLKRIDEFEENGKKWNFYFNGKKIEDSLDQVLIKAKDKMELRLE